jgi:hypothetical protein
MNQIEYGSLVKIRGYGGHVLTRRCVGIKGKKILICNEDEFQNAEKEKRTPECVGFPLEDLVEVEQGLTVNQ